MRTLLSFAVALFLMVPAALAQAQAGAAAVKGTIDTTWNCVIQQPVQTLPVPGQADRAYSIYQVKCTTTTGEVVGVKEKEGIATEFADATGNASKGHGVFVETLENGDTVTYAYQGKAALSNQAIQSGSNTWTITGGTGKAMGIKGSGTCQAKGNADKSVTFACKGTYTK
jgi:hypothetical protein